MLKRLLLTPADTEQDHVDYGKDDDHHHHDHVYDGGCGCGGDVVVMW